MPVSRRSDRPSFRQRDSYRDVLSDGYAHGRLNDAEFARRTEEALVATSLELLEELIGDLPRGALPVPVERGRGDARGTAGQGRRRSPAQAAVAVVTAAALAGLAGGIIAGPFMAEAQQQGEHRTAAGDTPADDEGQLSSTEPSFAYDDVMRAFGLAADYEEVSRIVVSGTSAQLHVPTSSGTTYDVVTADQQGRVSTEPGGTYGEGEPNVRIDPSAIDQEEVAAMVTAAPDVFAATTGNDGHSAARLNLGVPGPGTEYAGVEPGSPVVRVTLELGDYGAGGGTVTWTPDGERVLEVVE